MTLSAPTLSLSEGPDPKRTKRKPWARVSYEAMSRDSQSHKVIWGEAFREPEARRNPGVANLLHHVPQRHLLSVQGFMPGRAMWSQVECQSLEGYSRSKGIREMRRQARPT